MQGPVSGVAVSVGAKVGVAGKGVGVGEICVGGMAVGGRKGVGADGGEQATAKEMIENRIRNRLGKKRSAKRSRSVIINEKWTRFRVHHILRFFFDCARLFAATVTQVKRQGDFTRHRFLADNVFDLRHEVGIAAQVILGVLAPLTDANVAV